jgi:hypothetical protein
MATNVQPRLARQADVDIGYDYDFEHKWERFERGVWAGFCLLILAGFLGLFGRGPLNHVKQSLPDGTTVQYDRVVRFKSPSTVTFSVPVQAGTATIEASKNVVQKLGLQSVFPQPSEDLGSQHAGPFRFQPSSPGTESVFVQLSMQPSGVGPVTSTYRINGQTTIPIIQFIVP